MNNLYNKPRKSSFFFKIFTKNNSIIQHFKRYVISNEIRHILILKFHSKYRIELLINIEYTIAIEY
jgi:hypothetical protein